MRFTHGYCLALVLLAMLLTGAQARNPTRGDLVLVTRRASTGQPAVEVRSVAGAKVVGPVVWSNITLSPVRSAMSRRVTKGGGGRLLFTTAIGMRPSADTLVVTRIDGARPKVEARVRVPAHTTNCLVAGPLTVSAGDSGRYQIELALACSAPNKTRRWRIASYQYTVSSKSLRRQASRYDVPANYRSVDREVMAIQDLRIESDRLYAVVTTDRRNIALFELKPTSTGPNGSMVPYRSPRAKYDNCPGGKSCNDCLGFRITGPTTFVGTCPPGGVLRSRSLVRVQTNRSPVRGPEPPAERFFTGALDSLFASTSSASRYMYVPAAGSNKNVVLMRIDTKNSFGNGSGGTKALFAITQTIQNLLVVA